MGGPTDILNCPCFGGAANQTELRWNNDMKWAYMTELLWNGLRGATRWSKVWESKGGKLEASGHIWTAKWQEKEKEKRTGDQTNVINVGIAGNCRNPKAEKPSWNVGIAGIAGESSESRQPMAVNDGATQILHPKAACWRFHATHRRHVGGWRCGLCGGFCQLKPESFAASLFVLLLKQTKTLYQSVPKCTKPAKVLLWHELVGAFRPCTGRKPRVAAAHLT